RKRTLLAVRSIPSRAPWAPKSGIALAGLDMLGASRNPTTSILQAGICHFVPRGTACFERAWSMEAIIFVGVQGSGKTTFYRERFFDTHLRISLDMLRTRHREQLLVAACLAAKQPFVIDNTNPLPADRARYIGLAREA